jgi:hypothetical protein
MEHKGTWRECMLDDCIAEFQGNLGYVLVFDGIWGRMVCIL